MSLLPHQQLLEVAHRLLRTGGSNLGSAMSRDRAQLNAARVAAPRTLAYGRGLTAHGSPLHH
ncbi:MAG: hypothetical protein ACRELE_07695 [Gemmatimonadales bacterium]